MFEECLKNVFPDSLLFYLYAGEGVGVGVTENKDALYVVIFLW